jgi:hypothetical protein
MAKVHEHITLEQIRTCYLEDPAATVVSAAKAIGCSRLAFFAALRAHGVQAKPRYRFGAQGRAKWAQLTDREWLAEQLATRTFHEIAQELGTTRGNVADHAKRLGLSSTFTPGRRHSALQVGQKVGRLTLLEQQGTEWLCRCECGVEKAFPHADLVSGAVRACQKRHQLTPTPAPRDGDSSAPEYGSWRDMLRRCYDTGFPEFERYGAKGVTVAEELRSFQGLLAEVGPKPFPNASLERIDNTRPYEPGNVRWATPVEQANNRSTNRLVTLNGRTQTLAQWCRELGIRRGTVVTRMDVHGWSVEQALTAPVRKWVKKT